MEQPSLLGTFFPFIVLFALIYFLFILPQQKQAKAHKAMVDSLAKGDKIVTAGGIKASVVKSSDDFITIKLNDDTIVELDEKFGCKKNRCVVQKLHIKLRFF